LSHFLLQVEKRSSSRETYVRPRGPADKSERTADKSDRKSSRTGTAADAGPGVEDNRGAPATGGPEVARTAPEGATGKPPSSTDAFKANKKNKPRRDLQCWICHRWITDNPCSRDQHERSLYCMTKRYMWQGYAEGVATKMAEAYVASLWESGDRHQWSRPPAEPHALPPKDGKDRSRSRARLRSREEPGYRRYVPEDEQRGRRRRRTRHHDDGDRTSASRRHGRSREHRRSRATSERERRRRPRTESPHADCGRTRSAEHREKRRQLDHAKEAAANSPRRTELPAAERAAPKRDIAAQMVSKADNKKIKQKQENEEAEKNEEEQEEEESSSSSSSSDSKEASADASEAGAPAAGQTAPENVETRPKAASKTAPPPKVPAEAATASTPTAPLPTSHHAAALEMANSLLATAMREAKRLL